MTPVKFRNDGHRRCQAVSPLGDQCTKKKAHNRKKPGDQGYRHKSGSLIWYDNGNMDERVHRPAILDQMADRVLNAYDMRIFQNSESAATQVLGGESMAQPDPQQALTDWWMGEAASEVERTVPKAIEYGSTDLIDIGTMLARTLRRSVNEEEAAEMGVFFYLIGKIARWQSAIERGERPSDDTLFDIGVYVRMAQRIRHAGGWPGITGPGINEPTCDTCQDRGCGECQE